MSVSMAMVARLAGVSGQTVSRVVNDSPRVDPATRKRVEEAMRELGYRPHRAARALRTGRTHTIGLVVATLESVGNFRMLQATAEEAARHGYSIVVATVASDLDDAFAQLHAQGVDGVIVVNEASAHLRPGEVPAGMPLVVVDAPPDAAYASVHSDHLGGARAATEHLLALGHATVAHLAGPAPSFAARQREQGWRNALESAGVAVPEVVRGDWTSESGWRAASALGGFTAVFAANDQMALGVLHGLADRGVRVPEDVSVVGFDDLADSAHFQPPLTTVGQRFPDLAHAALELLLSAVQGQEIRGKSRILDVSLVIRTSATRS